MSVWIKQVPYEGPVQIAGGDDKTPMWALSDHSATGNYDLFWDFIHSPKCETHDCPWHTWYGNGTHQDDSFEEQYRKYCFTCAFWHHMVEKNKDGKGVITEDWEHYRLPEKLVEVGPAGFRGFGGRMFVIELGYPEPLETVETNNLWSSGTIPENMRRYFRINARFKTG